MGLDKIIKSIILKFSKIKNLTPRRPPKVLKHNFALSKGKIYYDFFIQIYEVNKSCSDDNLLSIFPQIQSSYKTHC